jgi:histidinol dehydrogenase
MTMKIIATSDTDFEAQLGRITGRLAEQERSQPPSARKKTIEVFGEPLSPLEAVRRIVEDVREKGDQAVADYSLKLDGCDIGSGGLR